jgi:hypothetical protein
MKEQREVFPRVGTFAEAMAFCADFRLVRYLKQSKASASCTGIFFPSQAWVQKALCIAIHSTDLAYVLQ